MFLTRAQVRRVDQIAIEEYGIPGIVLMENAAKAVASCADTALDFLLYDLKQKRDSLKVSVICGGGNNGGDGYAVARLLRIEGFDVTIFSLVDPQKLTGDAALNRRIIEKMHLECRDVLDSAQIKSAALEWQRSNLIVDAILGTGFNGELRAHIAEAIQAINAASALEGGPVVLAIDLPSGLDCDTGIPSTPTIRADYTVTFVAQKVGFQNLKAKHFLGNVYEWTIGAPNEIAARVIRETPSV
ncbi:MAG: NAD(P)H-hydrate epimerase [Planctomycetota bacterium]